MPAYAPRTNYMVPPNISGDPGYTFSTVTVYPSDTPSDTPDPAPDKGADTGSGAKTG